MQYSAALFLTLASLAVAAPDGCQESFSGHFTFSVQNITSSPASKQKRQSDSVSLTLESGVLKDAKDRTGEIVANHQFQFDAPLQTPRIASDGFSICGNGTLASPTSGAVFYQCLSGTFYNLYDQSQGKQCNEVYLITSPLDGGSPTSDTSAASSESATSASAPTSMSAENAGQMAAPASATPAPTSSSSPAAPVVASTGSPAASGNGTSFTAGSPSSTSTPEAFKGAADSLAVGKVLGVVALGLAGFAFAL